jgi:hypothetical protein
VRTSPYLQKTLSVRPDTTLIAFTDGLVERRGEVLDVGLERLREAATNVALALEEQVVVISGELDTSDAALLQARVASIPSQPAESTQLHQEGNPLNGAKRWRGCS